MLPGPQGYPTVPVPVVRTYEANSYEDAIRDYQADAQRMAQAGYVPINQQWVPDDSGRGCFWLVIIIILLVTIVGILLLPFVLGGRNRGRLTVTYLYSPYALPPR